MSDYTQNYMHISTYVYVCKSYAIKIYYKKRELYKNVIHNLGHGVNILAFLQNELVV
jgi:hypothetical protein